MKSPWVNLSWSWQYTRPARMSVGRADYFLYSLSVHHRQILKRWFHVNSGEEHFPQPVTNTNWDWIGVHDAARTRVTMLASWYLEINASCQCQRHVHSRKLATLNVCIVCIVCRGRFQLATFNHWVLAPKSPEPSHYQQPTQQFFQWVGTFCTKVQWHNR